MSLLLERLLCQRARQESLREPLLDLREKQAWRQEQRQIQQQRQR